MHARIDSVAIIRIRNLSLLSIIDNTNLISPFILGLARIDLPRFHEKYSSLLPPRDSLP